jgi:hypothetical protein
MTGTMSFADLYGPIPPGRKRGETAPASVEAASGKSSGTAQAKQPAIFWVILVGLLAGLRFVWETGVK